MLSYAFAVAAIAGATLIPAYLALYLIPNLKFLKTKYIAALGLGLTIWFFFDTFTDASELDVNGALYPISYFGGWYHVGLIAAFLLGITALAIFDHLALPNPATVATPPALASGTTTVSITSGDSATSREAKLGKEEESAGNSAASKDLKYLIFIPIAVAAVMGIHGVAEGWAYGATASSVSGNTLLDAFSPGIALPEAYSPLISYPLHKFFEATIIACVYTVFIQRNSSIPKESWYIPVLGILFALTSVIGASIGYFFVSFDVTPFYAFGVSSAFYAAVRLGEAISKAGEGRRGCVVPSYLGGTVFLSMSLGFFLLYTAALLH